MTEKLLTMKLGSPHMTQSYLYMSILIVFWLKKFNNSQKWHLGRKNHVPGVTQTRILRIENFDMENLIFFEEEEISYNIFKIFLNWAILQLFKVWFWFQFFIDFLFFKFMTRYVLRRCFESLYEHCCKKKVAYTLTCAVGWTGR